jgi:NET1-associated nuclear protein 1 (U3 small nucleolar RNA-associated protein 17)
VSPTGSSYALSLANNTVIVLSTTELNARTNIVGIQSRRIEPEFLLAASNSGTYRAFQPVPMAIDPKSTKDLLLCVPSSQPRRRSEDVQPEPYLQTFDVFSHRSVSRQALTRNNATDPNIAPDGRRILEPSVTHLQISHDGQWLATIDEWIPPVSEGMSNIDEEERLLRREVYLKFWRRDEKTGQWALESRIDSPHLLEDACAHGRVYDLVADRTRHGFATIGEDDFVKIWRPKTRLRDGIVVRGAGERGLINWSASRSLQLPKPWVPEPTAGLIQPSQCRTSRLAFSSDGSILAAAVSGVYMSDSGAIHLLDVFGATIKSTLTEIDVTVLCGIGIIGRHLVVISDSINVWDMVNPGYVYSIPVNTPGIDESQRPFLVRFATNDDDGTFAISLPRLEVKSSHIRAKSRISVFSTQQEEPLWSDSMSGVTMGLVARMGEKGYIALDSASCIRTITSVVSALEKPTLPSEDKSVQHVEQTEEDVEDDNVEDEASAALMSLEAEYDRPVVTHQNLEDLFHTNSVLPPPKELFHSLVSLFGGKQAAAHV